MPTPSSTPPGATGLPAWHWRAFALVLLAALIVPRLWQRGMFLDGVTYAALARNLAEGQGTLWAPSLSATTYAAFFEQPPLGIGLQAIAFAVLGDHPAVERAFALAIFAAHLVVLAAIWRRILPAAYDWLPFLFLALPAAATWTVVNNMLENTQALFTSLAVLACLQTGGAAGRTATAAWSAFAGAAVVAAVLVKTPVGLFPLAVPLLMRLLPREMRPAHPWLATGVAAGTVVLLFLALLLHEPARTGLAAFASSHLLPRLTGERGDGSRGLGGLRHLAIGVWLRMGIVVALAWLLWARGGIRTAAGAGFFLAVAGVASLPIVAASAVLPGHYFFPSMPFHALGAAALVLPAVASRRPRPGSIAWRAPAIAAVALGIATVTVVVLHGPMEPRDRALLADIDRIGALVPRSAILGTCADGPAWGTLTYLQRFHRVSLDATGAPVTGWFLQEHGVCAAPPACEPEVEGEVLALWRCPGAPGAGP